MTEHRRNKNCETAFQKWLRGRWTYGTLKVLDIDSIIVSSDYERGIMIEWKHASSGNRDWYLTRSLAKKVGFWSAIFIYDTTDGTPYGEMTVIQNPIVYDPTGKLYERKENDGILVPEKFDAWVREEFGSGE